MTISACQICRSRTPQWTYLSHVNFTKEICPLSLSFYDLCRPTESLMSPVEFEIVHVLALVIYSHVTRPNVAYWL